MNNSLPTELYMKESSLLQSGNLESLIQYLVKEIM